VAVFIGNKKDKNDPERLQKFYKEGPADVNATLGQYYSED
jgi:hypothetical protein